MNIIGTWASMSDAFPPSQEATSADGQRWRKCVGAAIINSRCEILIGERVKIPGAWNCPQGGMDAQSKVHGGPETLLEAASREAFEECGLRTGEHIVPLAIMAVEDAVCYEAGGWLKRAGFAGQQLSWVLFSCCHVLGDTDAARMCSLGGEGGEAAEFSAVRWRTIDDVIDEMWPAKRAPYEALREWATPILEERAAAVPDLSGVWQRDNAQNSNVVEALVSRGLPTEEAQNAAAQPYRQRWAPADAVGEWLVTTYESDGKVRRALLYPLGDWEEEFEEGSTLFGEGSDVLVRHTSWLPQPKADARSEEIASEAATGLLAPSRMAHTVWSSRRFPCAEISSRFLRDGKLVLHRTYLVRDAENRSRTVMSEEVFERIAF